MIWKIVAFVTLTLNGQPVTDIISMNQQFEDQVACNRFLSTTESIAKDVSILYPNSDSYKIMCLPQSVIQDMRISPKNKPQSA
jgi:hypothetical protein